MNTYRVTAISRESGKRVVCFEGKSATLAINTYTVLTEKRPNFFADFRVVLERLDPVVVMDSE